MLTPEQKQTIQDNPWLTDNERAVFDLYYRRGWKIEDIAAELNANGRAKSDSGEEEKDIGVSRSTIDRILKNIRTKSLQNL